MMKTEKKNVDPQKNVVPMFIVRRIKKKKKKQMTIAICGFQNERPSKK